MYLVFVDYFLKLHQPSHLKAIFYFPKTISTSFIECSYSKKLTENTLLSEILFQFPDHFITEESILILDMSTLCFYYIDTFSFTPIELHRQELTELQNLIQ